jgi:hypothetical protein
LLLKVQELEEKLLETQLQLERVTDEKLTHMLSIQKSPNDKIGLGYVAPSSDVPSSSKTVFVKPTVPPGHELRQEHPSEVVEVTNGVRWKFPKPVAGVT